MSLPTFPHFSFIPNHFIIFLFSISFSPLGIYCTTFTHFQNNCLFPLRSLHFLCFSTLAVPCSLWLQYLQPFLYIHSVRYLSSSFLQLSFYYCFPLSSSFFDFIFALTFMLLTLIIQKQTLLWHIAICVSISPFLTSITTLLRGKSIT